MCPNNHSKLTSRNGYTRKQSLTERQKRLCLVKIKDRFSWKLDDWMNVELLGESRICTNPGCGAGTFVWRRQVKIVVAIALRGN